MNLKEFWNGSPEQVRAKNNVSRLESKSRPLTEKEIRLLGTSRALYAPITRRRAVTVLALLTTTAAAGTGVVISASKPGMPELPKDASIHDRLTRLDVLIRERPTTLRDRLEEAVQMGNDFISLEYGLDAERFRNAYRLENDREFQNYIQVVAGCRQVSGYLLEARNTGSGYVHALEDLIHLNASNIAAKNNPSFIAFAGAAHERLHAEAPTIPIDPPEVYFGSDGTPNILVLQKGLVSYAVDSRLSLPNKQCLTGFRTQVDEAVVHEATQRAIVKVGFDLELFDREARWVQAYRSGILDRLSLDQRSMLKIQQQSQGNRFLSAIGQKAIELKLVNAPASQSKEAGDLVLRSLLQ